MVGVERLSYADRELLEVAAESRRGAEAVSIEEQVTRQKIRGMYFSEERRHWKDAVRLEKARASYRVGAAAEEARAELEQLLAEEGAESDVVLRRKKEAEQRVRAIEDHRADFEATRASLTLEIDRLHAKRRSLEWAEVLMLTPPTVAQDGPVTPMGFGVSMRIRQPSAIVMRHPSVAATCFSAPCEDTGFLSKPMDEWTTADVRAWLTSQRAITMLHLLRGLTGSQLRVLTRRELMALCEHDRKAGEHLWTLLGQQRAALEQQFEFDMPEVREQLRAACSTGAAAVAADRITRNCINPNMDFADGLTPLICAAQGGYSDCVAALLGLGADAALPADNAAGITPLHAACSHRPASAPAGAEFETTEDHVRTVHLLVEAGGQLLAEDGSGRIPLHNAAAAPIPAGVVELLLRHPDGGAREQAQRMADWRDARGHIPLDMASTELFSGMSGRHWFADQLRQLGLSVKT